MGYLNNMGLATLWEKIQAKISSMISAEAGKLTPYGYCETAAGTAAKTVTVEPAITSIDEGTTISVKFKYANTVANPTLNVNGLGAHAIKRYGTTAPSTSAASSWNANEVVRLVYDGSYWMLSDWNNSTYSSMSVAEYEAGTSGTARLITPARLKDAIQHWATGEANVQSDWAQTDSSADDYIKNKPTIPTDASEIAYDSNTSVATAISANTTALGNKVDKVSGKGLSTNDYTTAEKDKLAGIEAGAEANVNADWNASSGDAQILNKPTIPTKTSDLTNDSGFLTQHQDISGKVNKSGDTMTGDLTLYVPSGNSPGLIFQRGSLSDNYNDWKIYDKGGYLYFAQRGSGSAAFGDVGYIDTGGVLRAFTIPWGSVSGKPTFATVATSGSYNDLSDKPTIPSYSNATQSQAGLMSASDKQKLDALLVVTQDAQTGEVTIGTGATQNQNGEVTI